MSGIQRFFLVVEGLNDGYPNYDSAKIHFSETDPSNLNLQNLFICSPVFSVLTDGYDSIPQIMNGTRITFIMVPNIFPAFGEILKLFPPINQIWFSLGLSNLIIIENDTTSILSDGILEHLQKTLNLTASETWILHNQKICTNNKPSTKIKFDQIKAINFNIKLSDKLPLHIKFAVSEYIISVNKFLTASKKFTPYYYDKHFKTIDASADLVNDLSFLFGDDSFLPSDWLLNSLKIKTPVEARSVLQNVAGLNKREDLINDRSGRIIQFNSSMSYVYSQAYSGTFPIFDHIGIVRRHSLLGIGSAIGALFELVSEIEESLYFLPFETDEYAIYPLKIPAFHYFDFLTEPSSHMVDYWKNDIAKISITDNLDPSKNNIQLPNDFFNRLSFFSGRLGFREYDLSATAAMQVLVEGNSLQWNVINYTHEIIHNHVRMILNNLITPPPSLKNNHDDNFISYYKKLLTKAYKEKTKIDTTYKEYFILLLINFAINSKYFGSLTRECNFKKVDALRASNAPEIQLFSPPNEELRDLILIMYKDISEIFVHVIDFSYIYKQNLIIYIQSIWASWSTVTAVSYDIKQYVLRTLLIISLSEDGKASIRFDRCITKFLGFIDGIAEQNNNSYLFQRIKKLLEDNEDDDLRIRFYNCLIVSDLVYQFFIGKLENKFDNNDSNRLVAGTTNDKEQQISYNIETNTFEGDFIKSKVRFALDQLLRTTYVQPIQIQDSEMEKTSAWLLLSLSTYNKS